MAWVFNEAFVCVLQLTNPTPNIPHIETVRKTEYADKPP